MAVAMPTHRAVADDVERSLLKCVCDTHPEGDGEIVGSELTNPIAKLHSTFQTGHANRGSNTTMLPTMLLEGRVID